MVVVARVIERPVRDQVAERVRDERAPVPLDGAQHVGTASDHEARAALDRCPREGDAVAPVLAGEVLDLVRRVTRGRALGTDVHRDDDPAVALRGPRDMAPDRVEVGDAGDAPRAEAEHGDRVAVADGHGGRKRVGSGGEHSGLGEPPARFEESRGACVVRVIVRDVADDHARVVDVAQRRGRGGLLAQRVAERRSAGALSRRGAIADGALDVQQDETGVGNERRERSEKVARIGEGADVNIAVESIDGPAGVQIGAEGHVTAGAEPDVLARGWLGARDSRNENESGENGCVMRVSARCRVRKRSAGHGISHER